MIDLLSTENIWNYNLALSEFLLNQNNWFNKTIEQFRQQCLKFVDADDNLNNKSDNTKSRSTFNKMFLFAIKFWLNILKDNSSKNLYLQHYKFIINKFIFFSNN